MDSQNRIVNKTNNTKSSIIDINPKNAIKLDIEELDKSETYPEEEQLAKIVYTEI